MGAKQSYKLLLVIAVTVVVMLATVCRGSSVGHTPSANEEVLDEFVEFKDQSRQTDDARAAEKAREGKEGSESWTEWAKEKITGGLGLKQDNENFFKQDDENFLKDSSKKASDATYDTASGWKAETNCFGGRHRSCRRWHYWNSGRSTFSCWAAPTIGKLKLLRCNKPVGLPALILFTNGKEVPESRREGAIAKAKLQEYVDVFLESMPVA